MQCHENAIKIDTTVHWIQIYICRSSFFMIAMPKMTIDTLLQAARYIEENDKKIQSPPPQAQSQIATVPSATIVQHHVLPSSIPIQHVTLQPLNGHNNITLAPQPQLIQQQVNNTNTVRTIKKGMNVTIPAGQQVHVNGLSVMNSFDLINPPVIDQGSGEVKRKQPPMAFRTGTREVHNKLEKNRRAHLKECFDVLYMQLPNASDNKKTSNLNILASAIKHIKSLETQQRKFEQQMEELAKEKINLQQRFTNLKKEIMCMYNIDVTLVMPDMKVENESVRLKEEVRKTTKVDDVKTENVNAVASSMPSTTVAVVNNMNVLKLPKSITGALPVVASTTNGIKEDNNLVVSGNSNNVQQTVSVVPFYHPLNQNSLVVQKVIMPKGIPADLTQFVSSPQLTHFITTTQPATLEGKVMPTIVNAQYVVKPLVVVSKPSRNS